MYLGRVEIGCYVSDIDEQGRRYLHNTHSPFSEGDGDPFINHVATKDELVSDLKWRMKCREDYDKRTYGDENSGA